MPFSYAESANSSLLFSYMTNIYSMTPEATQIQFSTYKAGKSFLLTTKPAKIPEEQQPRKEQSITGSRFSGLYHATPTAKPVMVTS